MVKVNGPMFSLAASGTLAHAVTFSHWKGRPYVRERVIPSNPKSGGQVGRRAMFKFLTQYWPGIGAADRATWQDFADQLVVSTFNAWISENMKSWHNFLAPSGAYPPTRTGTIAVGAPPLAAEWEENRIKLSVKVDTLNDNWGALIFASPTGTFDTTVGNCIMAVPAVDVATVDHFWTPPAVRTYYFDLRFYTYDGTLGAEEGEISAAP